MYICPPRWTIVLFAATLLAVLPGHAAQAPQSDEDVRASLKQLTQVYEAVETNFADKIDSDRAVYKGAIPSMLRTLDPHSNFYDPQAFALLREGQSGHYYGVGMYVGAPEGRVLVMYPFSGSPAFRAGLRPGDWIVEVDDKDTRRFDVSQVSALLKGPRGTKVTIKVRRSGVTDPLIFHLTRDEVPRDSVTADWLKPGIGYIHIDAFNETTSHELDRALAKLGETNIDGLILDLRDNGGGLVGECVNVADRFLRKGQIIVSHRGRASSEARFTAKRGERGPEYPIVVMVNRNTASAAEILAGALQDHDRAWILGENTFGKGLVQAPFPLSGNSALLLTIAKYYTPSGRLIQRDYSHQGFYEYITRGGAGQNDIKDARKTDSGRLVYGGNGLTPDEKFSYAKLTPFQERLSAYHMLFFFFSADYFGTHPTKIANDWQPDDELVAGFQKFLTQRGFQFTPAEFDQSRSWIRDQLREELYVTAFSKEESQRLAVQTDPEIKKAVDSLPQSKALLERVVAMHQNSKQTADNSRP